MYTVYGLQHRMAKLRSTTSIRLKHKRVLTNAVKPCRNRGRTFFQDLLFLALKDNHVHSFYYHKYQIQVYCALTRKETTLKTKLRVTDKIIAFRQLRTIFKIKHNTVVIFWKAVRLTSFRKLNWRELQSSLICLHVCFFLFVLISKMQHQDSLLDLFSAFNLSIFYLYFSLL